MLLRLLFADAQFEITCWLLNADMCDRVVLAADCHHDLNLLPTEMQSANNCLQQQ